MHHKLNRCITSIIVLAVFLRTSEVNIFGVKWTDVNGLNIKGTDSLPVAQDNFWKQIIDNYYCPEHNDYLVKDYGTKQILSSDNATIIKIPAEYDITFEDPDLPLDKYNAKSKFLYFNKGMILPLFRLSINFMQNKIDICQNILDGQQTLKNNLEIAKYSTVLQLVDSNYKIGAQIDIEDQAYYLSLYPPYYTSYHRTMYYLEDILNDKKIRTKLLSSNLDLQKTRAYAIDDLGIGYLEAILFSDEHSEYILFLSPYPYTNKGQFYHESYMTDDEIHFLKQPRFEANELYDVKTCVEYMAAMKTILDRSDQRAHDAGEL